MLEYEQLAHSFFFYEPLIEMIINPPAGVNKVTLSVAHGLSLKT